jgi:hypothetical protein
MAADPTTSDAPAPSRLFTILGWASILLSLYSLVMTAMNHVQTAAGSQGVRIHLTYGSWELLSVLSAICGFGMWKRRSWAPNFVSALGGANIAQSGWWLVQAGPLLVDIIRAQLGVNPMIAAELGFLMVSLTLELLVWLVVLGAIFREQGRRQFPPSRPRFTTVGFFVLAGGGMGIALLTNSWSWFSSMEAR